MGLIQGIAPRGVRPKFMEGKKYKNRVMSDPETLRKYREWARINWLSHQTFWSLSGEQPIPLTDHTSADIPALEQQASADNTDSLVALGTMRIEQGDLAGARRYWDRAAGLGSEEGILLAGCAAWQNNDHGRCRAWQATATKHGYTAVARDLAEL